MRRAAFLALLSHWRKRPGQLLTLILGLAMATALWSGVQAINAEARASYDRAAAAASASAFPTLVARPGAALNIADFASLRRAGWPVSPVIEGSLRLGPRTYDLRGIDLFTHPMGATLSGAPDAPTLPDLLTQGGGIFAAPATISALEGTKTPAPLYPLPGLTPRLLLTDISAAEQILDRPGGLSLLELTDKPPEDALLADIAPHLTLLPVSEATDIAGLTDSFHLNLTAFGFLSFAVGLFILHAGIGLAFEQRRPMFRTMRAIGLPLTTLIGLLAVELLAIAALSALLGLVLGYVIAGALLPDVAATLRGLYGASIEGSLSLRPWWIVGGLGLAVVGTALAGAQGFWRVARMPLLASAQPRAWARVSTRSLVVQAALGLGLGLLALIIAALTSGLVAGFTLLGGLLLAAALALPLCLMVAIRGLSSLARGPLARWFWADTAQQLPGLSLALMALLLALSANIGVGTMVSSFRTTFVGWLDQRLASELYATARSEDEAARLREWLAPRVQAILPIWHADTAIAGRPGEIYGVADHPTYRDTWPMLSATPTVWDDLNAGRVVLISEQTARQAGVGIGDPIALGPGWTAPIGGIYSDYGNPLAQVITDMTTLTTRFPDVERLRYAIRIAPDQAPALRTALIEDFGLPPGAVVDQAAIKTVSIQIFERTFTVTGALNILTLTVAGFAILTSLLTLSAIRLPQLAPVWALGVSRRRLAVLELFRALALSAITFIVALPVGLALAWVLLAVVNVEAFGWRLPMFLFPGDWLALAGLAALAAVLSALLPALSLARLAPARLLQVFSSER